MNQQVDQALNYFKWLILDEFQDIEYWIAGGALRDYFSFGKPKSDVDVFFPNEIEYNKFYEKLINCGKKIIKSSENAILFKHEKCLIHLIKKNFYNSAKELINSFDFTVCCVALDHKSEFTFHNTFFMDLARRRLVINSIPFPLSTLQRLQKYIKKGFWVCNGGLLEIAKGIQTINFENKNQNIFEFYPDGSSKFKRID